MVALPRFARMSGSGNGRLRLTVVSLAATVFFGSVAWCQPEPGEINSERDQRMQEMERRIRAIKAYASADFTGEPLRLIEKPLLRFDDPARFFHDGTLWAWGPTGRPAALVTIERYQPFWSHELISLTSGEVSAVTETGVRWSPSQPGVEWKKYAGAMTPATSSAGRLRQMKKLVRQFAASETTPGGEKCELRLLPQPLHRYADAGSGLADGTLFAFAFGTNPEMIAAVECRRGDSDELAWFYGFAPLTSAGLVVRLDDQIVWELPVPPAQPNRASPYTNFRGTADQVEP